MRKMDLFELYNTALNTVNSQQGGCMKPYANFNQWIKEISIELFNEKFSDAETSQRNDDTLNNAFLRSLNVPATVVGGRNFDTVALPVDYGYFSSIRIFKAADVDCGCLNPEYKTLIGDKECDYEDPEVAKVKEIQRGEYVDEVTAKKLDNSRFGDAAKSLIMAPTLLKPIVTQVNGGIKVVPKGIGIVVLDYFRLPAVPLFAYTTNESTDEIEYDLGNSVQLDWPDLVENEFISRIKKRYASYTRNQQQYAEAEDERKLNK